MAAKFGNIRIMNLLLENGAKRNLPVSTSNGQTALQAASRSGQMDIVQWLLVHGAQVNEPPSN